VSSKRGYISGPPANPNCSPGNSYCHDFGSILNFTEYVFGLGNPYGIGGSNYPYADYLAPDAPFSCASNCPSPYSLADFFNVFDPLQARTFTPISGAKYPTTAFISHNPSRYFQNYPADPDDDEIEGQQ
jgi:hypothetical protein